MVKSGEGIMKKQKYDVLNDNFSKILLRIMVPLILANIIAMLSTTLVDNIVGKNVGKTAFTVAGLLATVISAITQICGGMANASWAKNAIYIQTGKKEKAENAMINCVYAIAGVAIALSVFSVILTGPLFKIINIPQEIYKDAVLYFRVYIITFAVVSISSFFVVVINGVESSRWIFVVNTLNTVSSVVVSYLLLKVLRGGLLGYTLRVSVAAGIVLCAALLILRRRGFVFRFSAARYKPDFHMIFSVIRYGLILSGQGLIGSIGYIWVSIQINRYLPLNYIAVLSVSMPLTVALGTFSSACTAFVPTNYMANKKERVKKFIRVVLLGVLGYGVFCFIMQTVLGRWYFTRLFDNPEIIQYGVTYWRIYGMGLIFVSIIYVIRISYELMGYSRGFITSGILEMAGNLISAFWLIPKYGVIGANLAYPLGWILAGSYCLISFTFFAKRNLRE